MEYGKVNIKCFLRLALPCSHAAPLAKQKHVIHSGARSSCASRAPMRGDRWGRFLNMITCLNGEGRFSSGLWCQTIQRGWPRVVKRMSAFENYHLVVSSLETTTTKEKEIPHVPQPSLFNILKLFFKLSPGLIFSHCVYYTHIISFEWQYKC